MFTCYRSPIDDRLSISDPYERFRSSRCFTHVSWLACHRFLSLPRSLQWVTLLADWKVTPRSQWRSRAGLSPASILADNRFADLPEHKTQILIYSLSISSADQKVIPFLFLRTIFLLTPLNSTFHIRQASTQSDMICRNFAFELTLISLRFSVILCYTIVRWEIAALIKFQVFMNQSSYHSHLH